MLWEVLKVTATKNKNCLGSNDHFWISTMNKNNNPSVWLGNYQTLGLLLEWENYKLFISFISI